MTSENDKVNHDELMEPIARAVNALALGCGTFQNYKTVRAALMVCIKAHNENPSLGHRVELDECAKTMTHLFNMQKCKPEEMSKKWESPFLTIRQIKHVSLIVFLLKNQFMGIPTLDPDSAVDVTFTRAYLFDHWTGKQTVF